MKAITEMCAYKTHYFVKHYQRHVLVDLMKLYQILYRSRWQNVARKGRNGRPAPCWPFCPFLHIQEILCHREGYGLINIV